MLALTQCAQAANQEPSVRAANIRGAFRLQRRLLVSFSDPHSVPANRQVTLLTDLAGVVDKLPEHTLDGLNIVLGGCYVAPHTQVAHTPLVSHGVCVCVCACVCKCVCVCVCVCVSLSQVGLNIVLGGCALQGHAYWRMCARAPLGHAMLSATRRVYGHVCVERAGRSQTQGDDSGFCHVEQCVCVCVCVCTHR